MALADIRRDITTYREEGAQAFETARGISAKARTEGRDLTAEESQEYERLMDDFESKRSQADRWEKEEGIAPSMTRSQALAEQDAAEIAEVQERNGIKLDRASEMWGRMARTGDRELLGELREIANKAVRADRANLIKNARIKSPEGQQARMLFCATDEYRDAYVRYLKAASNDGVQSLDNDQRAALNVGTGAQGGYLVPAEFMQQLVVSERFFGVMRQLATKITTAADGALTIPKVDPANRTTAAWVAEAAAFTESEDQFLSATLNAYKQGDIIKVSDELLLDSAFDILGFVAQSSAQALGILANTAYMNGTSGSTTTPEGLLNKATVGYTMPTGNTTTITYNGVVELFHSVLPAYRPRGQFVASDTVIKLLRELTDSQNRPLWQPSLVAGEPDTLLGAAIFADPDVPVPAASALSMAFGDVHTAYWIRDVQDVTVKILNELYAGTGQVGYRVHRRTDGDVIDTLAVKTLKQSAT